LDTPADSSNCSKDIGGNGYFSLRPHRCDCSVAAGLLCGMCYQNHTGEYCLFCCSEVNFEMFVRWRLVLPLLDSKVEFWKSSSRGDTIIPLPTSGLLSAPVGLRGRGAPKNTGATTNTCSDARRITNKPKSAPYFHTATQIRRQGHLSWWAFFRAYICVRHTHSAASTQAVHD